MSLRTKITLVLLGVIGLFATANYVIQQKVFFGRFEQLERDLAIADVHRVQAALQEEMDDVDDLAHAFAQWDALYDYTTSQDAGFVLSNLSQIRLEKQRIDLLYIVGPPSGEVLSVVEGQDSTALLQGYLPVLWSRMHTDPSDSLETLQMFPRDALAPGHPLAATAVDHIPRKGILLTEYRPLLVSAYPIRRTNGEGQDHGTLILGRFLGEELGTELSERTQIPFQVYQADGRHELPADLTELLPEITMAAEPVLAVRPDGYLDAYGTFNDIRQRPELVLHARIPCEVLATGSTALHSGLLSTITGGVVLLFVLLTLLRTIVLGPLSKLTRHVQWIGSKEDFRAKLGMDRDDELGVLSREFDRMMEQLEDARAAYVETARSAGMSQVATGILHNVGNVLSSVNVATDLVGQRIQEMSVGDLEKLSKIVESHASDLSRFVQEDARGKHLQPFLSALSAQLSAQRDAVLEEVCGLAAGVEHICELVKSQQSYSRAKDLREPTDVSRVIDEALRISEQALFHDPKLEIVRQYDSLPDIDLDRHRVLEILVNLVTNARQAMNECETRRLNLRLYKRAGSVFIEVTDTGKGIAPENISKVFHAGYTTKKTGMGYGLHSSANAASEFRGKLTVQSEGPGHGATFLLEIPAQVHPSPIQA